MATKLKNLKITKVDFVDEGANPDADIMLFKRREEAPAAAAEDDVLDKDSRSLMKRLLDAFRATFSSIEPGDGEPVDKSATSFTEEYRLRNLDKIVDDMWNLCYALNNSLCSIICDEEMDASQKQSAMTDSVNEFEETIRQAIESWMAGEPCGIVAKEYAEEELSKRLVKVMTTTRDRLSEIIEKSSAESDKDAFNNKPKGEATDMKFDKSKMTPAERAMLEQFEKNYGMEDNAATAAEVQPAAPSMGAVIEATMKSAFAAATQQAQAQAQASAPAAPAAADDGGDIYKGMSPEMKAEFESLKKFKEDTEDAALHAVAKGYEIIGKKEEDLFPVLKALKQTNQTAYDQMVATLDSAKAAVEKSGVFGEIGKSGTGSAQQGGALKEAESKAAELMKSKNGLTWAQAIDQVLQADPELAKRYEKED